MREKEFRSLWDSYNGDVNFGKALSAFENVKNDPNFCDEYIQWIHEQFYLTKAENDHLNSIMREIQGSSSIYKHKWQTLNYFLFFLKKEIHKLVEKIEKLHETKKRMRKKTLIQSLKFGIEEIIGEKPEEPNPDNFDPMLDYLEDFVREKNKERENEIHNND